MKFRTQFIFIKNILSISLLFLFGNCNTDNQTKSVNGSENSPPIPNLESETPVVWHVHDELYCYMYWIGNYETKIDSVITFDPATYNETLSIYNQTIRKGIWYLKDCEHNIYAESIYKNDSLVSLKKIRNYKKEYDNMKTIGAFEKPKLVRKEIDYF